MKTRIHFFLVLLVLTTPLVNAMEFVPHSSPLAEVEITNRLTVFQALTPAKCALLCRALFRCTAFALSNSECNVLQGIVRLRAPYWTDTEKARDLYIPSKILRKGFFMIP